MATLNLEESVAYFREDFIAFKSANLSIASSSVLYGLSVYTVFPVSLDKTKEKLVVFRLKDHYQRLAASSKIMDFNSFEAEWSYERFHRTVMDLLRLNKISEDVLVRATVFIDEIVAGTRIHDLKNSLCMYVYPLGKILPVGGVNLCVSSWTRTADNSIPSRAKINGSYINAALMKNEALLNGYDDAIALDGEGHVTESTVANIFIIKNGRLLTPTNSSDSLEGITRDTIMKLAGDNNIRVTERNIDRSELYTCDEAFLCGSSAGVVPILSIDKRTINNARPGSITKQIATGYAKVRKGDSLTHKDWSDSIGEIS